MINNYCNQENDVYVQNLAADQAVSDLSEEQLRNVLEQLTDHNLPDSEKCPLVRRLNAENAAKDESAAKDLLISRFCKSSTASSSSSTNTCRNRKSRNLQKSGSKDAEFVRDKNNGSVVKAVHSSQSLQDLMSSANSETDPQIMRAIGANRSGKRLNKASRANSFTMPSGSQHFCNNNISKESSGDVLSSAELRTNSQHSMKSTRNKSVKTRPTSHTSGSVTENCLRSDDSVVSDAPNSSRTADECYATRSVHSEHHNMDSCDKNCTLICNSSSPEVEQQVCEFEMKDLRQKVEIIEYSSDRDINSVDSFMELGLKAVNQKDVIKTNIAERVVNHNCDSDSKDFIHMSEDNRLMQFQGAEGVRASDPMNPYQDSDLATLQQQQNANRDNQIRNSNNQKKKKKTELPVKLSEEIEGHIGYKEVEYLEAYVNSNDSNKPLSEIITKSAGTLQMSTNPNIKESVKKKEKSIQLIANNISNKRKSGSNVNSNQSVSAQTHKNSVSPNIPLSTSSSSFSSDDVNSVSKHSDFAQRTDSLTNETTSPLNSSSDPKDKIQLSRENSDNLDDDKINATFNSSFSLINSNMSSELLYTASDSEMADREKGFVTPKSKHLKRRRGLIRRTENQRNQNCSSLRSSNSTTPSSSTVGTVGHYTSGQLERFAGMRGYESEREYTEDYRRKPNNSGYSRRKSLSSVPHSEQNSAYNSDGELSSHSMPIRNDSLNTEKSNSDSRTTPSSISSTPKASYADIAKHLNFGINFAKRSSMDAIYVTNSASVQYQDFPQLDLSLTPVADLSTPSSPNTSKTIEALVSPQQKVVSEKLDLISDSNSAPTSMTNTPVPQTYAQNECLFSETDVTVKNNNNNDHKTDETIGETEDSSVVPAVIMCDYTESVPLSDIGSISFGFFDDLSASSDNNQNKDETHSLTNKSSEIKSAKSVTRSMKTSPEVKSHVNTNGPKISAVPLKYIDVDKKSFNYDHIINFIKKAWDNAKRDHQCYQSYESIPKVN